MEFKGLKNKILRLNDYLYPQLVDIYFAFLPAVGLFLGWSLLFQAISKCFLPFASNYLTGIYLVTFILLTAFTFSLYTKNSFRKKFLISSVVILLAYIIGKFL